jgi:AcrR family transcriptional regulator
MGEAKRRRGVSRAEWLEAALEELRVKSITGLSVEALARSLGIAKAGFYWHFKDREDLLRQLLEFWSHEMTEVVSNNPQLAELEPRERLVRISEIVLDFDLTRYEMAIRQWALEDAGAARAVRRVNRIRLDLLRRAFSELGFEGDDLEMRTMLFVCHTSWESNMFPEISRKRRRGFIEKRVELLTKK